MYETIRRTGTRLPEAARVTLEVLWPVLKWVGLALLLVASALLVYLAAVLLQGWWCEPPFPEAPDAAPRLAPLDRSRVLCPRLVG